MEEEGRHLSILVQNPLLLDHNIQRIISFVGLDSLPSIRLVCRQWENFALPKLAENVHKFPIIFSGDDSKMARYLSYRAEGPRLLFNDFTLKNMAFSGPLVEKFMETCLAEITGLGLELNIEEEEFFTVAKTLAWIGSLVNLKTLTLNLDSKFRCSPLSDSVVTTGPSSSSLTKLKRLCLNYGDYSYEQLEQYEVSITLLTALRSCESLEELCFSGGFPSVFLSEFIKQSPAALVEISTGEMDATSLGHLIEGQNLRLKVFRCQSLELFETGNSNSSFSAFLERHKNTLEAVDVGDLEILANIITFPDVMPKLKIFRIGLLARYSIALIWTGRINFSPVNFPVQLPSLEKLIFYDGSARKDNLYPRKCYGFEYLRGLFQGSDPHPKLTQLCLPFASSTMRQSVGALFPEIRSLKMKTGLDDFPHEILKMWPGLSSLDLTLRGRGKKMGNNPVKDEGTGGSSNDSDSGLISIAKFKDLRKFKLQMVGDCVGSLIDLDGIRALCKSPSLEFLLINRHQITEEGTKEFLKCHPLLKKVDCPIHPRVYKIQREYLPNDFIPDGFSTEDSPSSECLCSFS